MKEPYGVALFAALVLAGCGGDDGEVAICDALTDPQVGEQIGADFQSRSDSGKALDGFRFEECTWESPAGGKITVGVVSSAARYTSIERALRGAPGLERVDGVGDEAFTASGFSSEERGGTGGRTVYIRDGERTVLVALDPGEGETPPARVVGLAKDALDGL